MTEQPPCNDRCTVRCEHCPDDLIQNAKISSIMDILGPPPPPTPEQAAAEAAQRIMASVRAERAIIAERARMHEWPTDHGCSIHWLRNPGGREIPVEWEGPTAEWIVPADPPYFAETPEMIEAGWSYVAPCLTPSEVQSTIAQAVLSATESLTQALQKAEQERDHALTELSYIDTRAHVEAAQNYGIRLAAHAAQNWGGFMSLPNPDAGPFTNWDNAVNETKQLITEKILTLLTDRKPKDDVT